MAHGALTNQLQCHPRSNFKGSRRLTTASAGVKAGLSVAKTANPRYLSRWISKHIYWQKIKKGYLWVVKLKNPSSFHHEVSPPLNFFRMRLGFSIGLFYKCQGALWNRMETAISAILTILGCLWGEVGVLLLLGTSPSPQLRHLRWLKHRCVGVGDRPPSHWWWRNCRKLIE